jgi:hypothetical protein
MMRKGWMLALVAMLLGLLMVPPQVSAALWEIIKDPDHVLYGNLDQTTLVDPLKSMGCAPVAVMNSFTYLQNKYPVVYDNSLTPNGAPNDVYVLAAPNYMNTTLANGTWYRDMIWGKYLYVENFVPNKTIYAAQTVPQGIYDPVNNPGGWTIERPQPAWVTEQNSGPSMQFLYNELVKCEDVEIGIVRQSEIGHALTLTSFHFNDVDGDWVFDPGDSGQIDFIDPIGGAQKWCSFIIGNGGLIYTDYDVPGTFNDYIGLAVTESPVPLPPSMLLLGSGLLGLAGWRRFRKG